MNATRMIRVLGVSLGIMGAMGLAAARADERPAQPGMHGDHDDLGLTADQKAKLRVLRTEQRKTTEPLREQLKIQRDELKLLVDKKAGDSALTAKLEEINKSRKALQEARDKFRERMAAIFTPEQRARLALKMGDGGRHGRWGQHPGMKDGKGGMMRHDGDEGGDGHGDHEGDDKPM